MVLKPQINIGGKKSVLSKWKQIIAASSVNLAIACTGIAFAWPSPMTSKMQNPDLNPLGVSIDADEEAWIGSLVMIAAMFGPLYSGYASEKFGRKPVLLFAGIPIIVGCILKIVANALWQIYLGRILEGLALGQLITCVPMYIGEISEKNIRGALGSFLEIFFTFGVLFAYSVGPFTSYVIFNIICIVPAVMFIISFVFMPESPNYLIAKEEKEKALEVLLWLRNGSHEEAHEELSILMKEYDDKANEKISYFDEMKKKNNIKSFIIAGGLLFFQHFSGIDIIQIYLQSIFEQANTGISAVGSSILVGAIQAIGGCLTPLVIDRWGRRMLLMISGLGMSVSLAFLGLYFLLSKNESPAILYLSWLPLTTLVGFVLFFCIGFGPVVWAVLGEIFDSSVKETNIALITSISFVFGFIISRYFTLIERYLGTFVGYWIFSGMNILAFLFVYFYLPETKGKSLQEIQKILSE